MGNYFDRRSGIPAFSSIAIWQDADVIVTGLGRPQRVPIARISPGFFSTLGIHMHIGSEFSDKDLTASSDRQAILTDEAWRSYFNSSINIIGQTFRNDEETVTVIGVLPPSFHFLGNHAFFFRPAVADSSDRQPNNRHNLRWKMIGRLAPGATIDAARAQLAAQNRDQLQDDPMAATLNAVHFSTTVSYLHDDLVRGVKSTLILLQVGAVFLLIIGSLNLVNLFMIRVSGRTKEIAVRQALGANYKVLCVDSLAETLSLTFLGGVIGLILGEAGVQISQNLALSQLPEGFSVQFRMLPIVTTFVGVLLLGVLISVPTIWLGTRMVLSDGLKSESRGGTSNRDAQRLRGVFITLQIILAFVLTSGAAMLGLSLKHLANRVIGFESKNVVSASMTLPEFAYADAAKREEFVERMLASLRTIPGVSKAAVSTMAPFSQLSKGTAVAIEGSSDSKGASIHTHYVIATTSDYWAALRIPLREGRYLGEADIRRKPVSCVVDEAFARRYWPTTSAIGHRLSYGRTEFDTGQAATVVGVVGNITQDDLAEAAGYGTVYLPYSATPQNSFTVVIRSSMTATSLLGEAKGKLLALDPNLPLGDIQLLKTQIDDSLISRRTPVFLTGLYAILAMLLAALGIYGMLSYQVGQRTREIGVRMALGANQTQIRVHFLSMGIRVLAVGASLGMIASFFLESFMSSLVFDISRLPISIWITTLLMLSSVTMLASLIPAIRATRISPLEALRSQ